MKRLFIVLVCLSALLAPSVAGAQAMTKGYARQRNKAQSKKAKRSVARHAKKKRLRPETRKEQAKLRAKLIDRATKKSDAGETKTARKLGKDLYAVYTRSQMLPSQFDRFQLFTVDKAGRARELSARTVYRKMVHGLKYERLVELWKETVSVIPSSAYRRPDIRVQVDKELRFLEKEIERRVGTSGRRQLPWKTQLVDPVKELDRVGNGKRLAAAMAKGTVAERNSLDMLARGIWRLHSVENLPLPEFRTMLSQVKANMLHELEVLKLSDHKNLKRKNSKAARLITQHLDGFEFGNHRSAMITPQRFRPTLESITHELNHGANRIPNKIIYTELEVLSSELVAWSSERKRPRHEARTLKQDIADLYLLNKLDPKVVPNKPRGVTDNWVPKFPIGKEAAYTNAYFRE